MSHTLSTHRPVGWTDLLGNSDALLTFQEHLSRVTDSERPVLILGERGTGKELAAQRLHYMSRRWDKAFVTLLCTALNPNLLEAELFGHEAGAFTGARERRAGYFERADQGTLFLDEVADMPLPLQDKLLRVIEYGVLTRVGGTTEVRVDVRVVAATNRDVRRLAAEERLRPDLLDRLACEVLHVPPLRERGDDIVLLARHFADRMALELGEQRAEASDAHLVFSVEAERQLRDYAWPGNVRELKNVVERSVIRAQGSRVEQLLLDPYTPPWGGAIQASAVEAVAERTRDLAAPATLPPGFSLTRTIDAFERRLVCAALEQSRHRQTEAARLLGLSYHQFRGLYKKVMQARQI